MAANVKRSENLGKHLTKAELAARQEAEAAVIPDRPARLKAPKSMSKDKTAKKYWSSILERMDGLDILDSLDSEILALYCTALSRRDAMQELYREMTAQAEREKAEPDARLELLGKLDGLLTKIHAHEKILLQYAGQLGLTPDARARLARKRAALVEHEPDGDLFGD